MTLETIEKDRWSLKALLPSHENEVVDAELSGLEQKVETFEEGRGRLSSDISEKDFLAMLRLAEEIRERLARLVGYANLWFAEDTQSQQALSFLGRMDQIRTDVQNRTLFFSLWWKELEPEPAQRLLAASGDYAYYLESLRRFRPYTLSEAEEKVINVKDVNGPGALVNLYEMITNRFTFEMAVDGETRELTRDELSVYFRDPAPDRREAAYQELYRVYSDEATVLGQIYNHVVRDWTSENVSLRGFESPIAVRNLANNVPDSAVETLLQVCRENMPLFHRYFALKARWLGVDRLRRYDIYAPVRAAEKTYDYPQAVSMVLETLDQFSPLLSDRAERVFVDDHIDAETRPGKRGGAFCYSVLPGLSPWVLVNYTEKIDDVLTLAHEIGHAIHSLMAADHTTFTFHATLPLAETASVFSEMLLTDRLRRQEDDPQVLCDLLVTVLDGAYATVARQAYFVLFEIEAHRRAMEGATTDELCDLYMENLRDQFGDAVALSDDFRWEWLAIPHIHATPFYCYAYSFGQLLVLALYRQYKEEGEPFVPRYLKILSYGGSASPQKIINEAGFDIHSRGFWQGGFDVLAGLIDDLESLA